MNSRLLIIAGSALALAGCPFDSDDNTTNPSQSSPPETETSQMTTYEVTVTNATSAQPLSPIALLAHDNNYTLFKTGEASSDALEIMAESGDNTGLIDMSSLESVHITASGNGIVPPGSAETLSFDIDLSKAKYLSLGTMLVNTNDAFAGFTQFDLSSVDEGITRTFGAEVWDAGTEGNDELAASIPGPAGGGEGFNPTRNDDNRVTIHAGVISQDDGLTTSALFGHHRFDNPGIKVSIKRVN